MNRLTVVVGMCLLLTALAPRTSHAELEFEVSKPRIFSIQKRPYTLGHEFQLGLGVLPLDAFYIGAVLGGSYTYHFTDFWAWELVSLNFSQNFDTSLEDDLLEDFGAVPTQGGGERITLFGSSNLVIKPLFGKLAVFNSDVIYSETFLVFGGGPVRLGDQFRFSLDAGLGLRFWSTELFSVRVDVRDYLVFAPGSVDNSLFIMFSGSFNFQRGGQEEAP